MRPVHLELFGQTVVVVHRSHFSVALRHSHDLPDEVKLALQYARSGVAQLTGRELERGIEPLEMYAQAPGLFAAMRELGTASGQLAAVH